MQCRLDLTQLYAVTAALDLRVGATHEMEQAIRCAAHQVTGLVHAVAGVSRAGTGQECALRLFGIAPVTRAQAHAANVELADFVVDHGLQLLVQDQQLLAGAGGSDGNRFTLVGRATRERVVAAYDGRFSGTVQIGKTYMRQPAHPMDHGGRGDRFSGKQDLAQCGKIVLAHDIEIGHQVEDRRHGEPLCKPRVANELGEFVRQEIQLGGNKVKFRAGAQRAEDVECGYVETQRRMLGDPVGAGDAEVGSRPRDEIHHGPVADHHPLGQSGGSRGEQDVCDVVAAIGRYRAGRRKGGEIAQGKCRCGSALRWRGVVEPADDGLLAKRRSRQCIVQSRANRAGGENAAAVADFEHPRLPLRGACRIHRHVNRIGLQHAEHGDDRGGHFRHQQADPISAAAACVFQQVAEPVGCFLQRAVGQAGALECQRPGFGMRVCLRSHAMLH